MSKSHVAGWASDAPTPAQLKEFFAQVESGRVTNGSFQRFLRGKDEEGIPNTYPVTVPYRGKNTIKELLAAGRYDWTNSDITDEHFPQEREGDEEVVIELVHLDHDATTDAVLAELSARGLRPANLAELLAFGAKCPDLQRQFPIIELGQSWRDLYGRDIVFLDGVADARSAGLHWIENRWLRYCRFAAVRK